MKFPVEGKPPTWFRFIKKMINSALKTTDQSLCCRSAVRSLEDFHSANCTSFFNENDLTSSDQSDFRPVALA